MSYRLLPDESATNNAGTCNNCQNAIWWNKSIRHPDTGRQLPLNEPFQPQIRAAIPHKCMSTNPPKKFINKYNDPFKGYNHDLYVFLHSSFDPRTGTF